MGWMYSDHAQYAEAETAFKKALKIDPGHYKAHVGLGWALQGQGKYVEAAAVYKQALGIDPEKVSAYAGVLWAYLCGGGDSSALQDFLKKSVAENSVPTDQLYGALATLYAAMGTPGLARQYHEKAEQLRLKEYDPVVADNYRHLKAMLDQRGVRLVCVQYPMLGLEPLRKIFQGQADGIVFVDNERVFKDAVKRSSLREYFRDMFGGDFGHCTDKGNQLLAGNIADVIAREVFGK